MCDYHIIVLLWIILGYYLSNSQGSNVCNRYYLASSKRGIITSPNYPFNYPERQKCYYHFHRDPTDDNNRTICFQFHRFELSRTDSKSCFDDYLEFYSVDDQTTIRYCGKGRWNRPDRDTDTTSHVTRSHVFSSGLCWTLLDYFVIVFSSNIMLNKKGFYATFEVRDTGEHGVNSTVRHLATDCYFDPDNCSMQCLHGYKTDDTGCRYCDCLPAILVNTAPCKSNEYTCFNRKCITESERCDGVDHCGDGSDEGYLHARCTGSQNIRACNFEEDNCNLIGLGWERTGAKYYNLQLRHDHTVGTMWGGHFMNADMADLTEAKLIYRSVPVEARGHHCLSFWYYLGNEGESLSLSIASSLTNNTGEEYDPPPVWHGVVEELGQWRQGEVDIPDEAFPITEVIFEARKQSVTNNVALDDISLLHGECFGDDLSCTFEMSWCGWSNDANIYGEWERQERSTPNYVVSGNNIRISLGFYYISVRKRGRLISRPLSSGTGSDMCFRFMYRMQEVNNLTVIITQQTNLETSVWSRHGSHTPQWTMANVELNDLRAFQIVLQSETTDDETGNVELDNLQLRRGYCHQNTITKSTQPITSSPTRPSVVSTSVRPVLLTCVKQFMCLDHSRCVPQRNVCDGSFDCNDFSDEKNCPPELSNQEVYIGIAVAILLILIVVTITAGMVCKRRKRSRRSIRIRRRSVSEPEETTGPPPSYNLCLVSETVQAQPYEPPPRYSD